MNPLLREATVPQGRWNLVTGYGSCQTNILEIYYCLPQSAIPIFKRFTLTCHINILKLPTALILVVKVKKWFTIEYVMQIAKQMHLIFFVFILSSTLSFWGFVMNENANCAKCIFFMHIFKIMNLPFKMSVFVDFLF